MKFIKIQKSFDIDFIKSKFDFIVSNEISDDNIIESILETLKQIDFGENIVILSDNDLSLNITMNLDITHIIFTDNLTSVMNNQSNTIIISSNEITDNNDKMEYSLNKIDKVLEEYKDKNIHVIIDDRYIKDNFNIFSNLTNFKISLLEIINIKDNKNDKLLNELLVKLLNIKERVINIFTEYSEILIYREKTQSSEEDVGWNILKGVDKELKNKLFDLLKVKKFVELMIENEIYLVSKTNMDYQNNITYFDSNTKIDDLVLFPEEKKSLCFELAVNI